MAGERGDVLQTIRVAIQGSSKYEDLLAQVRLLDERVRPERAEQLLLRQHALATLDQEQEHVKGLGGQILGTTFAEQDALRWIQHKGAKLKCGHGMASPRGILSRY